MVSEIVCIFVCGHLGLWKDVWKNWAFYKMLQKAKLFGLYIGQQLDLLCEGQSLTPHFSSHICYAENSPHDITPSRRTVGIRMCVFNESKFS